MNSLTSTMNSNTVYDTCKALSDPDASQMDQLDSVLKCIGDSNSRSIDAFFMIYTTSLVFFMQAGFAMLCAGNVQYKNVQNSMLKNLLDACGAALGFYSVGYAFAYGGDDQSDPSKTFIGTANFFLMDIDGLEMFWLFQFAFAASSATIVAGTLAERCQMAAYLCYSVALTGFVYPVVAHSIWSPQGILCSQCLDPLWGVGVVDFAGSSVVHLTGGTTALIATFLLGPRRGRFYDSRGKPLLIPKDFPGHSTALQVLGVFILWFGWYGFNIGSALSITGPNQDRIVSIIAVNTTLAAASACVSSLIINWILVERSTGEGAFSLASAMNGCLSGLVAITGGCALVEPWGALIIGFFAGILYLCTSKLLIRCRIDDAVDAVPVHMTNGIWGTIAVGLLATQNRMNLVYPNSDDFGLFVGGGGTLLACNVIGVLFILGWVTVIMFPFFLILNYLGWFRADPFQEIEGLDISYHGAITNKKSEGVAYGQGNQQLGNNLRNSEERRIEMIHHPEARGSSRPSDISHASAVFDQSQRPAQIELSVIDGPIDNNSMHRLGGSSVLVGTW